MKTYPKRYELRLEDSTYARLQKESKKRNLPLSFLIREYIEIGLNYKK